MKRLTAFDSIFLVWLRYFAVYRKSIGYGIVTTFVEPILYLFSFGYGLAQFIPKIESHGQIFGYRQFILSGIVAQTIMFQGFFEAAYGSFIRMYYQRIFHSMASTPITLSEVIWGELLWDASKSTFAASVVLLIGVLVGDFNLVGALIAIPFCFLGGLLFSSLGLWVASKARTIEQISYPQYLLIFPMFLFCGIFYPLEKMPEVAQWVAWVFPLTAVNSLMKTLLLGTKVDLMAPFSATFWLIFLVLMARRSMTRRLIQ